MHGTGLDARLLTALAAVLAGMAGADTIRLQNGNSIEGIVTQETDTQIVLELGPGSTTVARNMTVAVEHASGEANDRLRNAWKQKYFLHKKYVPEGLAGLAAEFVKLEALREEALRARRSRADLSAKEIRLQAEQEQIHTQIVSIGLRIRETPPEQNVEAYNALISENNALLAKWTVKNNESTGCRKERAAADDSISAYQDAIAVFSSRFLDLREKPAANGEPDKDRELFFARLAERLADYSREFSSAAVAITRSHDGVVVAATVNDRVQGQFLVDTGAGRVTVSEAFARRLQLDPEKLPVAEFTMADGSKVKGRTVVLRAMAVGEARAENVEAAILPGRMGEQVDGLLGMSFLKRFAVSLDGNNGKLILRQFTPKGEKTNSGARIPESE